MIDMVSRIEATRLAIKSSKGTDLFNYVVLVLHFYLPKPIRDTLLHEVEG